MRWRPNRVGGGRWLLAVTAMATVAPAPALSQETGSLIRRRTASVSEEGEVAARVVLQEFARCVVSRYRKRVDAILNLPLGSPDYVPGISKVLSSACLSGGDLHIPRTNVRGAFFEAMYNTRFGKSPVVFPADQITGFAERNASPGREQTWLSIEQFGECVSRSHAAEVRELLASYPGSQSEAAAIAALRPAMSGCVQKGQDFSFSRTVLRGGLAEGLYWLSMAAASAAPQGSR